MQDSVDSKPRSQQETRRRRMKDFYDLWIIAQTFAFAGAVLRDAVQRTFERRRTSWPEQTPAGLSDAFAGEKDTQWRDDVSASSAIKWAQRWRETGSVAAKPRGGSVSQLDKFAKQILAVIAEQPDRTLIEIVAVLRKRRIRTSRSSLWRFLDRHDITLKKNTTSR